MSVSRLLTAVFTLGILGASTACTTPDLPHAAAQQHFDKLLRECEAVPDDVIVETVGGSGWPNQYFHGAVCMWRMNGPTGDIDVTFGWFENGSVRAEEKTARTLGYEIAVTTVEGTTGFSQRRPGTPPTCAVTAPYSGVITWWVQGGSADSCETARRLMESTLQRNV
ncbi:DUF3558 domain-containing protein [Nocardia sp. NPDC050406]|uniref:DUF3558 domain-containing protein n=1 Tax=Nocardia sp. NPDC050406 TaxID=3364318 RepID=UPI0037A919DE